MFLYLSKFLIISLMIATCISCGKKNGIVTVTESRSYTLVNTSTGSPTSAGIVVITKLTDGKASLSIDLAAAYRVPSVIMKASITTMSNGAEVTYSDLGNVDGTTGKGAVGVVLISTSGLAVTYNDLVAKAGYVIRIMNGTTLQASTTIN